MDVLRKHLLREGHLNKPELTEIITEATNILSKETFFTEFTVNSYYNKYLIPFF
jgi:hypothetical protein